MPIINLTPPAPPAPPTPAQLLAQQASEYQLRANQIWQRMQQTFNAMAAFVWSNPNATPAQAFAAFGANASDLLNLSAAYLTMVGQYTGTAPPSPVPAGYTLTPNADGTVTVTTPATPTPPAS